MSDYDKGLQHAMGSVGDESRAEQVRKALEGYDKGMSNAYGNIGDGLKAEQARDASYNKGMQHALGGSKKTDNSNVASEDSGSRNEYYNEKINRAADDYLNEFGGRDDAETKEAWAVYGEQVDELVEQRDAYNRAAMGVDASAGDENGGGSRTVPMDDGTVPKTEEEKPITPTQGILDDMFSASGEGLSELANTSGVSDSYTDGMKFAYGVREDEKPDPTTVGNAYVSGTDFDAFHDELWQQMNAWCEKTGLAPDKNYDLMNQIDTLTTNRTKSEEADKYIGKEYETPVDAAKEFGINAASLTASDGLERVAIILTMTIPVVDSNGNITYEERSVLESTLVGQPTNVVQQLFEEYGRCLPLIKEGATISFVHTHPSGSNKFSGVTSGTAGDLINAAVPGVQQSISDAQSAGNLNMQPFNFNIMGEMVDAIKEGFNNGHFSGFQQGHDIGDRQVTWLPGVDTIYMVSTNLNEVYGCTQDGPIMDPDNPKKYLKLESFIN